MSDRVSSQALRLSELIIDRFDPFSRGYGLYGFSVFREEVPRIATGVEDVTDRVEDGDGELVGSQVGPDVFHRIEFG